MVANPPGCRPAPYARHRPERTVLYRLVQGHLETYLALAREGDGDGHAVPGYVERELRRYLECGILAYGFARARCPECGHDFLVAFSCKGRGYAEHRNMLSCGLSNLSIALRFKLLASVGSAVHSAYSLPPERGDQLVAWPEFTRSQLGWHHGV